MKNTITNGYWMALNDVGGWIAIVSDERDLVARVCANRGDDKTGALNALAISAVPELISACESALEIWEKDPRHAHGGIYDSIKSALKKARGTK